MTIFGTSGNDHLSGTAASDDFDVSQGGNDTVKGRAGDELIYFGATFTAADTVFGGNGADGIGLEGDYSEKLIVGANIDSIEQISCLGDFNYKLEATDALVAAGRLMVIDAGTLVGTHRLHFDGSAETDGKYFVTGNNGQDVIKTGNGNDEVFGGGGDDSIRPGAGSDIVNGGAGSDTIMFVGTGTLDGSDRIDDGGDADFDIVVLDGDYSAGLTFQTHTFTGIYDLELTPGNDYTLDCTQMKPGTPFTLNIRANTLGAGDVLNFTGAGIVEFAFSIWAGAGDDTIVGGNSYDTYIGGGGADAMTAGKGNSVYIYLGASDSFGSAFDTISGFDAAEDFFFPTFLSEGDTLHTTGYDGKITHGALSAGSFNADLAAAIDAGDMAEDHAVLFRPDSGSFAGQLFIVIDANNVAGYQANDDIVVRLSNASHMGSFDFDNFGTAG